MAHGLARELSELYAWLDTVPLADVVPVDAAAALVHEFAATTPPPDELARLLERGVADAHAALLADDTPLADLISRDDYDAIVAAVGELTEVRREVIDQVTTSSVYSRLISHVLYHGLKNYVLTQNVVVRNVPGASSLVRLGQNVVRSATPNLEKGIDRTLTAFVRASVNESIRDSQEYLETILDDAMIRTIADEIWAQNSGRSVARLAGLAGGPALGRLTAAGAGAWSTIRAAPLSERLAVSVVEGFYAQRGGRPVGVLLRDVGLTPERLGEALAAPATAIAERARADGYLDAVRARLDELAAAPQPQARHRSIVDVHVVLRRAGRVLMLRRANTSYGEGLLCFPSGHLERGESVTAAAVREAREEIGIRIDAGELRFLHVLHRGDPGDPGGDDRIGFFFEATDWAGEPVNAEPHKCSELVWVDPADPPTDVVPYQAAGLAGSLGPDGFSLHGWE